MKEAVRGLVWSTQLEFVNGGWCMHDEASVTYLQMIDQTTRGHMFLLQEFGLEASPTVGWQLDPFGHSNTQAHFLTAKAGMHATFFGRMDYQDRDSRFFPKTKGSCESTETPGGTDTFHRRSSARCEATVGPRKGYEWIWEGYDSCQENESQRHCPPKNRIFAGFLFGSNGSGNYAGPFSFEDPSGNHYL